MIFFLFSLKSACAAKKSQKLEAEETCKVTLPQIVPTPQFLITWPMLLTAELQRPVQKLTTNKISTVSLKYFLSLLEVFASVNKTGEKKSVISMK